MLTWVGGVYDPDEFDHGCGWRGSEGSKKSGAQTEIVARVGS